MSKIVFVYRVMLNGAPGAMVKDTKMVKYSWK
jgi:hypothetical protein